MRLLEVYKGNTVIDVKVKNPKNHLKMSRTRVSDPKLATEFVKMF